MKFQCKKCGEHKSISHFYYIKNGKPTRYCCRECWIEINKKPLTDERREYQRVYQLQRNYKLAPESYEALLKAQNHKCAICGKTESGRRLATDHDHRTGKIRGLLCSSCNLGLGYFRDNPEILEKAIKYLKKSSNL